MNPQDLGFWDSSRFRSAFHPTPTPKVRALPAGHPWNLQREEDSMGRRAQP